MAAGTAAAASVSPAAGKCFISYAREDQASVRRLHDALPQTGHECWVDWESIPPSAKWRAEIKMAIEAANAFLFLLSPRSANSEVCRMELSHAVQHNKRIVAVVVEEPEEGSVPDTLREINWIFLGPTDDFQAAIAAIGAALDTDLDWVKAHTRLLVRAIEWESRGRDKSLLLRGADLSQAQGMLDTAAGKKPAPTELQREFLASAARYARRLRRMRLTLAVTLICVAAVAAIILYPRLKRQRILAAINNAEGFAAESNGHFKIWFNTGARPDAVLALLPGLPSIDEVNLSETRVTEAGFRSLAALTQLKALEADGTSLSSKALVSISKLRLLERLTLDNNTLSGSLERLRDLPNLRSLELSGSHLQPGQLGFLSSLTKLEILDLSDNAIGDEDLKEVANLRSLKRLNVGGSKVSDAGLRILAGVASLQALTLTETQVGDAGVAALRGLRLKEFWAKKTNITDASMPTIAGWNLQILSLPITRVTDAGIARLKQSTELKELYLGGTVVSDLGLKQIAGLPKLQLVYVPGNAAVSDEGLLAVSRLPQLREVNFESTKVTERGADQFRKARPKVTLAY